MYEKSEIQKQFPINENKLWWYHAPRYLCLCIFFLFISLLLFVKIFYIDTFSLNNFNEIALILTTVLLWFLLTFGVVFTFYKNLTINIKSFYFNVIKDTQGNDWGVVKRYQGSNPRRMNEKKIAFKDIKCVTLSRLFLISDIYTVSLKSNKYASFWHSFFNSVSISGFDYKTAVAFKKFLEERIEQSHHGLPTHTDS